MAAIRFVDTAAGVNDLREHLLTVETSDQQAVLGLDTEWKPVSEQKSSPASILQVRCFVVLVSSLWLRSRSSFTPRGESRGTRGTPPHSREVGVDADLTSTY